MAVFLTGAYARPCWTSLIKLSRITHRVTFTMRGWRVFWKLLREKFQLMNCWVRREKIDYLRCSMEPHSASFNLFRTLLSKSSSFKQEANTHLLTIWTVSLVKSWQAVLANLKTGLLSLNHDLISLNFRKLINNHHLKMSTIASPPTRHLLYNRNRLLPPGSVLICELERKHKRRIDEFESSDSEDYDTEIDVRNAKSRARRA